MPESIRAEIEAHGGLARTEGPDANGITIYHAVDGSFISVRRDGTPAMRGFKPPTEGAAVESGAPAAPAARGTGMTQQELEALLAQMGALGANDFREETKQEDIPNPDFNAITDPRPTVKKAVTYRTWVKPGTNQRVTVKVNDDGSYTQTFSGADPDIKSPADTKPSVVATDTTDPFIVINDGQGNLTTKPNPNYQGPKPDKPTITTHGADLVQIDPGGKVTVLRSAAEEGKTYSVGNRIIQIKDGKATVLYEGVKDPETIDIGEGRKGTVVKGPNGEVTIREVPVQAVPRPAGPSIPTFVVGQAAAALRAGFEQINAEVAAGRQTPAWGEARKKEMLEVANVAKDEAATAQREQESSRAAQVNLATTKATALSNGFTTALTIVSKLNDSLPEGSTLGGQMFAALLGINMLNLKASGIYDIQPPGTPVSNAQAQPAPPPPPPNMADKAAVAAYQQAVAAQVKTAAQPAPPTTPPVAAPSPPKPVTAPTAPARPAAPTPPPAKPGPPPPPVTAPQAGAYVDQGINPATGEPTGLPPQSPPVVAVPPSPPAPTYGKPGADPSYTGEPMENPGGRVLPQPYDPANLPAQPLVPPPDPTQVPDGEITKAMPQQSYQQYAALNTLVPKVPFTPPDPNRPSVPSQGLPLAVLHAQAASTPPWRLDDATIEQMRAAGIDDDTIFSVPRVSA